MLRRQSQVVNGMRARRGVRARASKSSAETRGCTDAAGSGKKKAKKYVFGRREENAGAAGLSPDTMINAVGLGPVVVAWVQLLVADHQLAVKQMQLFNSGMAVTRIVGSRPRPDPPPYAVFFLCGPR